MTPSGRKGCLEVAEFSPQVDVAKIIIHKRDQPSTFLNFFETDSLPGEDCAEIDLFAVQANAPTAGDADGVVVERIIERISAGRTANLFDAVSAHLFVEESSVNAEQFRGFALVPVGLAECTLDERLFEFGDVGLPADLKRHLVSPTSNSEELRACFLHRLADQSQHGIETIMQHYGPNFAGALWPSGAGSLPVVKIIQIRHQAPCLWQPIALAVRLKEG